MAVPSKIEWLVWLYCMNAALPCEQFPQTSLREITTLKLLRHKNIVALNEVVVGPERERSGTD